jgi:uncharacterized membrane protein
MLMTIESYPVSQDPWLLAISIVSASFVAYVALRLGERVTQSHGRARGVWLVGAATALGTGIWSMHFTGMLAFSLPVPIDYDVSTVLFALLVAIVLYDHATVRKGRLARRRLCDRARDREHGVYRDARDAHGGEAGVGREPGLALRVHRRRIVALRVTTDLRSARHYR